MDSVFNSGVENFNLKSGTRAIFVIFFRNISEEHNISEWKNIIVSNVQKACEVRRKKFRIFVACEVRRKKFTSNNNGFLEKTLFATPKTLKFMF